MKRFVTFAGIAILFVLLSAPSFVSAATRQYHVGQAVITHGGIQGLYDLYSDTNTSGSAILSGKYLAIQGYANYYPVYYYEYNFGVLTEYNVNVEKCSIAYIPTLDDNYTLIYGDYTMHVYHLENDYENNLPPEFRPTWTKKLWQNLFELYYRVYGFYPQPGSFLYDMGATDNNNVTIIFPTNAPTPTPTPRPTPIPVQTIYVPSGNGDYTIIYQYPDGNGNITQSPYNPNVEVNVDVDCDCNNGGDYNPQDPMYYSFDGLTWASVDGDLTGSPAMSAGQSLELIKSEVDSYDEPIKVVSNSFGSLPAKWLGLVGLLGACLIVAGLIRTFLGG